MRINRDYIKLREVFDEILVKKSCVGERVEAFGGASVDLLELFWAVRERGGGGSVSMLGQWGAVAEEIGLSSRAAAGVEALYVRHLGLLDQWIQSLGREVVEKDHNVELMPLGLERKLRELLLDVSDKSRVNSNEKRMKNENEDRGSTSTDQQSTERCGDVAILDSGVEGIFSRKRKRETFSGMLSWLAEAAKNPSNANAAFDNLGEADKQRGKKGKEFITLVLGAREALVQSRRDNLGLEENDERVTTSTCVQNVLEAAELSGVDEIVSKDIDSVMDKSRGGEEVFSRKRKREAFSGMLNWLTETAKNPGRSAFQNIGKAYKQKEYRGDEIPSLVLSARDALLQKRSIQSIGKSDNSPSQKKQRMHPSMYEDDAVAATKRFSPRILSQIDAYHVSSDSDATSAEENPFDDGHYRKRVPVGPLSQADVPEWTGVALESDPKWLGTLHWPPKTDSQSLRDKEVAMGKGRGDSCRCRDPGSIECVRVHIADEKERLKSELGMVFYIWGFHRMGEGVSQTWTKAEEKKFNSTVRLNPPSMNKIFWNKLRAYFRTKSWKCLVSYYFNVFVLRRRTYQNRLTPCNIDSDDDESEAGSW